MYGYEEDAVFAQFESFALLALCVEIAMIPLMRGVLRMRFNDYRIEWKIAWIGQLHA